MVIINRLGKGIILILCESLETKAIAYKFICYFIIYYGIPLVIISNYKL